LVKDTISAPRSRPDRDSDAAQRLDRSEESLDLKKAVLAGFAKSRFWKIVRSVRSIDLHAVSGVLILLASVAMFGIPLLRGSSHDRTLEYVFIAAICPLSFWFVVHQRLALLRNVWKNEWGKLAYTLTVAITVTASKILADQQIRLMTQSNPSLFPSAQQAITVYNIVCFALLEIGILIWVSVLLKMLKAFAIEYGVSLLQILDLFSMREMLGLTRKMKLGSYGRRYDSGGDLHMGSISTFFLGDLR
jgi:hypothetical protein